MDMTQGWADIVPRRLLEYVLAAVAMFNCVAVAYMTLQHSSYGSITVVYLVEIAVVGLGGLYFIIKDISPSSSAWGMASWAMAGILLAFVYLAGFSIGLFLTPAAISMIIASALADRRRNRRSLAGVLSMLFTAFIQAVVVLGMMRHR